MDRHELIRKFQEIIVEIYKQENLQCIRGLDNDYKIKNKQILVWHSDVTRKCKIKYKGKFDYFKNIDDLLLCSDEILYFTGQLFLYRPFINNPLIDAFPFSGCIVYPNYQNLEAKRYYMFSDITSEKIYNFWDRIGDLIASFFPDLITPERIYFPTALDIVPKKYQSIQAYNWLQKFRKTEYKDLNTKRKHVVHYTTSDTDGKYKHLFNSSNREEIEKWVNERNEIADYYKNQINLTIEGFYNTLTLLEEIGQTLFKDIE